MKQITAALALLAFSSLAGAQTPPKANLYSVDISPEKGLIYGWFQADLGFPLGKKDGVFRTDCTTGKTTVAQVKETFDGFEDDLEGGKPIIASKVLTVGNGAVTLNAWYTPVRFFCKGGMPQVDFSAMAKNDALLVVYGTDTSFNIDQDGLKTRYVFQVPVSSNGDSDNLKVASMKVEVLAAKGLASQKTLGTIYAAGVASGSSQALFLYDAKTNTLLPVQYAGNSEGAKKVRGRAIGQNLELYYAPDYKNASGWMKITIDFTTSQISWQKVDKPASAKFGN